MTSRLDNVRQAERAVVDARSALRREIILARAAGETVPAIAEASGLTRQRVYQILTEEAELERVKRARVAEIDARYESLLDVLAAAEGRPGDYKRVTAIQNGQARKLARKGIVQRTVTQQLRDMAESKLLRVLDDRGDEPVIRDVIAQLDEAALLRKELATLDDTRAFGMEV